MVEPGAAVEQQDIRPIVGRRVSNRGLLAFAILLAIGAGILFSVLEARRSNISSPSVVAPAEPGGGLIASPPPLVIPPMFTDRQAGEQTQAIAGPPAAAPNPPVRPAQGVGQWPPRYGEPSAPIASPAPQRPSDPAYVYQDRPALRPPGADASGAPEDDRRATASHFRNPSTTVPQGTVIQAVLETALNSNHPGYARAVVSYDVSSFDGSRVLIPKGSKLFGEYKAEVSAGQNRALIRWRRLTRPDGSIIDVDSPSADPLGRAGVKGRVNSHFFARFGGAILQSTLDLGVQLAARQAGGNTVIVGLPGSTQIAPVKPDDVKPTLKVTNGASVSVFVMRDLDFTDVEL